MCYACLGPLGPYPRTRRMCRYGVSELPLAWKCIGVTRTWLGEWGRVGISGGMAEMGVSRQRHGSSILVHVGGKAWPGGRTLMPFGKECVDRESAFCVGWIVYLSGWSPPCLPPCATVLGLGHAGRGRRSSRKSRVHGRRGPMDM
jgi:hypothetical protein